MSKAVLLCILHMILGFLQEYFDLREKIVIFIVIQSSASPDMSHPHTSNYQNMHEADANHSFCQAQKVREVYISPFKEGKEAKGGKEMLKTSPCRFIKLDNQPAETLPPRAIPFRRSLRNNSSKDRLDQSRERSGEYKNSSNATRNQGHAASLQKRLHQQTAERDKWRSLCTSHQQKMKVLTEQLSKIREEKQLMSGEMLNLKQLLQQHERNLAKSSEQIESLNRNLKECRINQKSLANLKNIQNQLETIQQKNLKLTQENEELTKSNKKLKNEIFKKKDSTSESQMDFSKKEQRIRSLELEVKRLKEELHKDRSQRQILLQTNLHELEKKLYEKQNEIKKISIRLNYLDRKKYDSIDEIKTKKDQEIKDLRQRFLKVSKDLRETKNKIEEKEKKKNPKERLPTGRRIKSSTLLGLASQSEELTFQLSSEV